MKKETKEKIEKAIAEILRNSDETETGVFLDFS